MILYLMFVLDEFFGFFKLFEYLGVVRKVLLMIFVNVLQQINLNNDELELNELKVV